MLRQLLRDFSHTAGLYHYLAKLVAEQRRLGAVAMICLPPHRAARRYRLGERLGTLKPDAYLEFEAADRSTAWFIEWERRATYPAAVETKLAPYLQCFAHGRNLAAGEGDSTLFLVVPDTLVKGMAKRVIAAHAFETDQTGLRVQVIAESELAERRFEPGTPSTFARPTRWPPVWPR